MTVPGSGANHSTSDDRECGDSVMVVRAGRSGWSALGHPWRAAAVSARWGSRASTWDFSSTQTYGLLGRVGVGSDEVATLASSSGRWRV